MGRLARLAMALGAYWLMAALPEYLMAGPAGLAHLTVAVAACLVGALPGVVLVEQARNQSPQLVVFAVLAGNGLRMMVVLAIGLVVSVAIGPTIPGFSLVLLWLNVLCAYLAMLGVELVTLAREQPSSGPN